MAEKKNSSGPERVLGVGAMGDINDPERVPTRAEQEALEAGDLKKAAKVAKEEDENG